MSGLLWLVVAGVALCSNTANGFASGVEELRVANHRHQRGSILVADASPNDDLKKAEENVKNGVMKTIGKTAGMSPTQMFLDDARKVLENFMPGKRPALDLIYGPPAICCAVGIVWLAVYMCFFYISDREEHMNRWKHRKRHLREEDPRMPDVKPDLILLFHHPNHPYADKDNEISMSAVQHCMVKDEATGYFSRMEACLNKAAAATPFSSRFTKSMALGFHRIHKTLSARTSASGDAGEDEQAKTEDEESGHEESGVEDEEAASEVTVTLGAAREALLQDICHALPQSGFEILAFSSIDDDEIFVGVSIENPAVIRDEIIRGKLKLQVKHEVVEKLAIGQDPDEKESSPPYIKYDPRVAKNIMGEEADDRSFYKTFHGKKSEGNIISGTACVRLIHRHLSSHLNLDAAVSQGILKDWYPVHSRSWVSELNAVWAGMDLLKDFTFVQPMSFIHDYFGSRLAFTFAWNGVYCKMLFALLPVALVFQSIYLLEEWAGFAFKGSVVFFSIVLVMWSKIASNLWEREQEYFRVLWDLNTAPEYAIRPDFRGTLEIMPEDSKKKSLQYPRHKYMLRQVVMWIITLAFCACDFVCVYVWISVFEGRLDIVASICLALMVQVFTAIYNPVVDRMTKEENHKYQSDFYNSYLMKLFIFQFVNQFAAYFFIVVKQQHTSFGCPNHDCIGLLREQLSMTLCMLVLMRLFQVALSSVKVKIFLWWEDRTLKKELEGTGKKNPVRHWVEEQAKYEDFRIRQQIEAMVQLVIALGYVLIFGAVVPSTVLLCFINFLVQLRATAWMSTSTSRRPLPRRSTGLGAWERIVKFLMRFGVIFSGFLLVSYGPSFEGTYLITKISGMVFCVAVMHGLWALVSLVLPPTSNGAQLLQARRQYTLSKIAHVHEEAKIAHIKEDNHENVNKEPQGRAEHGSEILCGDYHEVPHLEDFRQRRSAKEA